MFSFSQIALRVKALYKFRVRFFSLSLSIFCMLDCYLFCSLGGLSVFLFSREDARQRSERQGEEEEEEKEEEEEANQCVGP